MNHVYGLISITFLLLLSIDDICLIFHVNSYINCTIGNMLRNFNITVGPHEGTYKKCGLSTNDMKTGEIRSFSCESNARGTSLKITVKETNTTLSFCEVFVFGKGMVELNIYTATKMERKHPC